VLYDGGEDAGCRMETLGAMLRRARLAQGRDLADLAEQIKVHARYLEALEADDLDSLPGGFFYKSFVRQYASALGIDASRVEKALAQTPAHEPAPPPPPMEEKLSPRDIRPAAVAPAALSSGLLIFNGILPSIGVLILVIVACGGFSMWWNRLTTMSAGDGSPRRVSRVLPEPEASPAPSATPSPAPEQSAQQPSPSPSPAPSPAASPTPTPSPGAAGVTLVATTTADSWVHVWCDGKSVFTGLMKAGERKTFEAAESARLRTGNAQAMSIVWNGKPVEFPGPAEFVRDVSFTRDAWQPTPGAPIPTPRSQTPAPKAEENEEPTG